MLTLYCNSFRGREPKHTQFNQINLMCGSHGLSETERKLYTEKNFVFDDIHTDNISHLNKYLGDLTGLYHVWKHTNHEFVGTNQYRRFYNEEQINSLSLNENTLYVSNPAYFEETIAKQFIYWHSEIGLKILHNASKNKKIDFTVEMVEAMYKVQHVSIANMFFAHNKLFNRVCDILFPIIFELYEGTKYTLDYIQPPTQTRMLAFLAERILTMMYFNKDYYFGNIEIQSVQFEVL